MQTSEKNNVLLHYWTRHDKRTLHDYKRIPQICVMRFTLLCNKEVGLKANAVATN